MKTATQTIPRAVKPVRSVNKRTNKRLFYPVYDPSELLFFCIFLVLFLALSLMHLCGVFLYAEHETALFANWNEHLLIFRFGLFAWAAALGMMIVQGSLHLGKKWMEKGKQKAMVAFRRVAMVCCGAIVLALCTLFSVAWFFAIPFVCLLVVFATPAYERLVRKGRCSPLWLVVRIGLATLCLVSVVLFLAEIQVVTGNLVEFVGHVFNSCLRGG